MDSIVRLRVESEEFDSKLKRAAEQITRYTENCRAAGGTLEHLDDGVKEVVQSLGSMDTKSGTLRGRLSEMTKAFTDLSAQYRQLTDAEKSAPFGKSLEQSLGQLRDRIIESKNTLSDIQGELQGAQSGSSGLSGALDTLTGKFGLSVTQLAGWGAAIAAAQAALDVARDAFLRSESGIDEWGRTLESGKAVYGTFLDTINGGSWSAFFTNVQAAVQGARELYDAMDRLASIKANNAAAIAVRQEQIAELRVRMSNGEDVGKEIERINAEISVLRKQATDQGKTASRKQMEETIRSGYRTQTGHEISSASLGKAIDDIIENGQAAFDKYAAAFDRLDKEARRRSEAAGFTGTVSYGNSVAGGFQIDNSYDYTRQLNDEERRQYALAKAITESETRLQAGIAARAAASDEAAAAAQREYRNDRIAAQNTGVRASGSISAPDAQEKAARQVEKAQQEYAAALSLASVQLKAGTIDAEGYKRKELQEQERLFRAYGQAYDTYADNAYKEAQDAAAARIVELGGEVAALTERQKAAREAAREMEAAERRMSAALDEAAASYASNDLKSYAASMRKAGADPAQGIASGGFTYTDANLKAYTQQLREEIAAADIGSELYSQLTERLADANAIGNLMQEAIQNGIDTAQFDPQELWSKLTAADPAQFITDEELQGIVDRINDYLAENKLDPVKLDFDTGNLSYSRQVERSGKSAAEAWNGAADAVRSMSSAFRAFDEPVLNVAALFAEAIANVAAAFAQSLKGTFTPWDFIAGVAGGVAAMSTAVAAIKSVKTDGNFATGGIVPGNSFNDELRTSDYGISSGELILNRAQQGNIASQLTAAGTGAPAVSYAVVTSDNIRLLLRNGAQKKGKTISDYLEL